MHTLSPTISLQHADMLSHLSFSRSHRFWSTEDNLKTPLIKKKKYSCNTVKMLCHNVNVDLTVMWCLFKSQWECKVRHPYLTVQCVSSIHLLLIPRWWKLGFPVYLNFQKSELFNWMHNCLLELKWMTRGVFFRFTFKLQKICVWHVCVFKEMRMFVFFWDFDET